MRKNMVKECKIAIEAVQEESARENTYKKKNEKKKIKKKSDPWTRTRDVCLVPKVPYQLRHCRTKKFPPPAETRYSNGARAEKNAPMQKNFLRSADWRSSE